MIAFIGVDEDTFRDLNLGRRCIIPHTRTSWLDFEDKDDNFGFQVIRILIEHNELRRYHIQDTDEATKNRVITHHSKSARKK